MKKLILAMLLLPMLAAAQTPFPTGVRLPNATNQGDTISALSRIPMITPSGVVQSYVETGDLLAGVAPIWGDITGDLSDQVDLWAELGSKVQSIAPGDNNIIVDSTDPSAPIISLADQIFLPPGSIFSSESEGLFGYSSTDSFYFSHPNLTGTGRFDFTLITNASSRLYTFPNVDGTVALTSDLSGFVPASRTLTAGLHISGGGTLAANRTFALTPQTNNWIVDDQGNQRMYFGSDTDSDNGLIFRLSSPGHFQFRDSDNNVQARIYANGSAQFGATVNLNGTSAGNANLGYVSFFESDGTTRVGRVGYISSGNSTLLIQNEIGGGRIELESAAGTNGLKYFDGGSTRTVWHSGNSFTKSGDNVAFPGNVLATGAISASGTLVGAAVSVDNSVSLYSPAIGQGEIVFPNPNNGIVSLLRASTSTNQNQNLSFDPTSGGSAFSSVWHGGATNVPGVSSSAGRKGDMAYDANYIYICTDNNTWKRVALSTW